MGNKQEILGRVVGRVLMSIWHEIEVESRLVLGSNDVKTSACGDELVRQDVCARSRSEERAAAESRRGESSRQGVLTRRGFPSTGSSGREEAARRGEPTRQGESTRRGGSTRQGELSFYGEDNIGRDDLTRAERLPEDARV